MINWYRVHRELKELVPMGYQNTLKDTLDYLYTECEYSLEDIRVLCNREIAQGCTLSAKMRELGIAIRSRGGDNSSIFLPLTLQDFVEYSVRELAYKHGVSESTIRDRHDKLLKEEAKKGVIK